MPGVRCPADRSRCPTVRSALRHDAPGSKATPQYCCCWPLLATVLSTPAVPGPAAGSEPDRPPARSHGGFAALVQQVQVAGELVGALPISFHPQDVETVSATLGIAQLKAGLLAGGIGLALVILYCLFYYRGLGLVVIASLLVSASIIYASIVLLGRSQLNFALSLAGVAGFIVAIGITADSFVVFFERMKDEVRDGRSGRTAVPKAWVRARRTILSADAVSLIAAIVLVIVATGPVSGFAFTLGLSTIIDLVVVFMFTHPLVSVLSGSKAFTSPRFSGLGEMRVPARDRHHRPDQRRRYAYEGVLTMAANSLFRRLYRGESNVDFIGSRRKWYTASAIIIAICILAIVLRGFNFSIDFVGGDKYQFPVKPGTSISEISDAVAATGVSVSSVQTSGNSTTHNYIVQTETNKDSAAEQKAQAAVYAALERVAKVDQKDINLSSISGTWGGTRPAPSSDHARHRDSVWNEN